MLPIQLSIISWSKLVELMFIGKYWKAQRGAKDFELKVDTHFKHIELFLRKMFWATELKCRTAFNNNTILKINVCSTS